MRLGEFGRCWEMLGDVERCWERLIKTSYLDICSSTFFGGVGSGVEKFILRTLKCRCVGPSVLDF